MDTSLALLASSIPGVIDADDIVITVADVTHDSRQVDGQTMFVAVRGAVRDGHTFVEDVAGAGAPAVLVEERMPIDIPQIVVADSRSAMAHLARVVHGLPDTTMTMIGITGTNGKTTVASMVESMLSYAGQTVGVIGTLGARIDGQRVPLARTTPESTDLQRLLAEMRDRGVDTVVMEVSSHAVSLHRVDGIAFDVAAFTNLTQDHLDFHGSMDAYFAAKARIFEPTRASHAVINAMDPHGRRLADMIEIPVSTVAVLPSGADIVGDVTTTTDASDIVVTGTSEALTVRVPLGGSFNAENALVAIAIADRLGVGAESMRSGLASLPEIPGRMQHITRSGGPTVLVDYAHTPAAVARVVGDVVAATPGRVTVVVGAGGDRDRDKRRAMGEAAAPADAVVVTNDNPRSEDPDTIAEAVAAGVRGHGNTELTVELDRRQAIRTAIQASSAGDVVLILGKGHEQGQEIDGRVLPFDDASVVREELELHHGNGSRR